MANAEQVAELRRKTSEPDQNTWSDAAFGILIDEASGDINAVAADVWELKASMYAELTDITEAGSSRKNSQLYKNSLEMVKHYRSIDNIPDAAVAGVDYPTTTKIVRPA